MLHISQSTISRDINYMQSNVNKRDVDPYDQLFDEYEKMMLTLDETVKEMWKIIDSSKNKIQGKGQINQFDIECY